MNGRLGGRVFAAVGGGLALVLLVPLGITGSLASWDDVEYVHGGLGVVDCTDSGDFRSTGGGIFLDGGLLPVDLSAVAGIQSLTVSNDGTGSTVVPATANSLGSDAYAHPLDVAAFNGQYGLPLTNVFSFPLDAQAGVINQYGRALSTGYSAGASGLVNDSGAILVSNTPTSAELPGWASLKLSTVVTGLTGAALSSLVTNVSDVALQLGAVGSSATLDACNSDYFRTLTGHLNRQYEVAGLGLDVTSPLVGQLVGTVNSTVQGLQSAITALAGSAGLVSGVTGAVTSIVNPLLGGLGLGGVQTSITLTPDFSAVNTLLTTPIVDSDHIVSIDLVSGTASIDLANLMGGVDGLNNLDPNTELLVNAATLTKLSTALTQALDSWKSSVLQTLKDALKVITVHVGVAITLQVSLSVLGLGVTVPVATVNATVDASLASLLAANPSPPPVRASSTLLPCTNSGLVCGAVSTLLSGLGLNNLLGALTGGLVSGLARPIGLVVQTALVPVSGLVDTLGTTLATTVITPLVTALGGTLGAFFGSAGVASITVNVQNDPLTGNPEPSDWAGVPTGRYNVAAMRVAVLDALGPDQNVDLDFATAFVGPNPPLP